MKMTDEELFKDIIESRLNRLEARVAALEAKEKERSDVAAQRAEAAWIKTILKPVWGRS